MHFVDFKNRTLNILNRLDTRHFANVINTIKTIEPKDNSGFADISAKASILFVALEALLANNYYESLTRTNDLFLAHSIYDDLDKVIRNIRTIKPDHIIEAKRKLADLTKFLQQQEHLATVYASRPKNKKFTAYDSFHQINKALQPTQSLDRHSDQLIIDNDVDVEKTECFDLSQTDLFGVSGLMCCVGAIVYGKSENKPVVCIGSFAEIEDEDITAMLEVNEIDSGSEEIYLIGGSVASITALTNLLLNTELPIHDMHVTISMARVDQSSIVIINPAAPDELHYLYTHTKVLGKHKRFVAEEEKSAEATKKQKLGFFPAVPAATLEVEDLSVRLAKSGVTRPTPGA